MNRFVLVNVAVMLLLSLNGCQSLSGSGSKNQAERAMSDVTPTTMSDASAKAHVELGMAYIEIGRFDIALEEAQVALRSRSDYAPAYHLMGLANMYINKLGEAKQNFERALSRAPNDPDFNNSYGWFQCLQGQHQEGLRRLELAANNPHYRHRARAYMNTGLCYLHLKNDGKAEQEFKRVIAEDSANVAAFFYLAEIAYRRGSYAEASAFLVQLHQTQDPTAESAWLGVRTERKLGRHENEASYAARIRTHFQDSKEYNALIQGRYE